jgi:hypothetical protein
MRSQPVDEAHAVSSSGPAALPGVEADAVAVAWRRWAAALAVPAALLGIVAYPDVQQATLPLPAGLLIVGLAAAWLVATGRPRLLILLPLISAYLPAPALGFAVYPIVIGYFLGAWGGHRLVRRLDAFDWLLLAVLLWTGISWLANLGAQTDLWSLPVFALTFLTPWLLLFVARAVPWTERELRIVAGSYLALGVAQLAPALLKPLVIGQPEAYGVPLLLIQLTRIAVLRDLLAGSAADLTTGTAASAHHLGIALMLLAMLLVALALASRRRVLTPLLAAVVFVFLMTDSKHVILAALPAGTAFAALVVWPSLETVWRRRLKVAGAVIGLTAGPYLAARVADVAVNGLWRPYFVIAKINPKVQLVLRTGELMGRNDANTWIGFGAGSFATRAATIRATDVLFKETDQLPSLIPPHTSPAYRSVAYDLYTSQIVETARFRSGVLTNPFSSVVGIIAEYGILGSLLVLACLGALTRAGYRRWRDATAAPLWRAAGATLGFAIPFLCVLGLFDSYFEQPDITALVVVLGLLALEGGREPRAM